MRQRGLFTIMCAALMSGSAAAHAGDSVELRYCVAPSAARHIIYLSPVFKTNVPMDSVESAFAHALDGARVQHDAVQCPRGDPAMRQHAIGFNEEAGNRVIDFNWTP